MAKQRDLNLDLIRAAAVVMVLSVHFFLNCGFYDVPLRGGRMMAATVVRTGLMICVPLFMLLTGCLRAERTWEKGRRIGLGKVLVTYVLASAVCLAFRTFHLHEPLTALDWLRGLLHFSGAPYGWYVEMFIGLSLLSPFLSTLWQALSRSGRRGLLAVLCLLTFLPTLTNVLRYTRFYLMPLPDWWVNLYPIAYYFLGAALGERRREGYRLGPAVALGLSVCSTLVGASLHIWEAAGGPMAFADVTYWGGFFTAVSAVLFFSVLQRLPLERLGAVPRRVITLLSTLSLPVYLLSYVSDQLLYPRMCRAIPQVNDRLLWFAPMVLMSLVLSLALAWLLSQLQRRLTALCPRFAGAGSGRK